MKSAFEHSETTSTTRREDQRQSTSRRNAIVASFIGLAVLLFIGYSVTQMSQPVVGNKLTGTVIERVFTPRKEQQISFTGRHLEGVKEIEGDFMLKVRVENENRIYDVPVEKPVYDAKEIGDSVTFVRPPGEQR